MKSVTINFKTIRKALLPTILPFIGGVAVGYFSKKSKNDKKCDGNLLVEKTDDLPNFSLNLNKDLLEKIPSKRYVKLKVVKVKSDN